jgi:hypothetical protein
MKIKTSLEDEVVIDFDSKIITTYDGIKISMNKIESIGSYLFDDDIKKSKRLRIFYLLIGIFFILVSLNLIFNPMTITEKIFYTGGTYDIIEKRNWLADILSWTAALFLLIAAQVNNVKIRRFSKIDYSINHELGCNVLIKDSEKSVDRVYKHLILCRGKMDELKKIRNEILEVKSKLDLVE